jgi:hypothetical protein
MKAPGHLAEKLATFTDRFSPPTIIATYNNNNDIMAAKLEGPFHWHKHDETDEFFLVLRLKRGTTHHGHVSSGLVRVIIRSLLLQRHHDDEKDAHPHAHRCGGYTEDQIPRHCLLPARFSGTIARAHGEDVRKPTFTIGRGSEYLLCKFRSRERDGGG